MDKKRLFTAIDLPKEVKRKIRKVCDSISEVRWTKPEQLHLTLSFIGDTDTEMIPLLSERLERLRFAAFDLCISGAGFFHSGVFYLKLEESTVLSSLKRHIDTVLYEVLEYEADNRLFMPHITLARFKRRLSAAKQKRLEETFESIFPVSFMVDEFILYSSKLSSQGAVHTPIRTATAQK